MSLFDRRVASAIWVALVVILIGSDGALRPACGAGQDLTSEQVKSAIMRGMNYLASQQISNGSFMTGGLGRAAYPVGPTALPRWLCSIRE